ncbi:uncharacterized oxidoreductase-like protein [Tanacetum coccineum]
MLLSPKTTISTIGSRSLDKATAFALENHFPESAKVYGSYDAVLDDPDVDAVYVPLPTSLHLQWVVLAAEKKKHILLEKPVALNVGELDTILEACESNGVQFMDATMWMHHPRTAKMKDILCDQQRFGQLKSVHSNISYIGENDFLKNDIRVNPDLDSLGALGDTVRAFYAVANSRWAELSLGCVPEPSEFKITTDLNQESLMVQEFARLVEGICNGMAKLEKKWAIISRKTQVVIDAVITSIMIGF